MFQRLTIGDNAVIGRGLLILIAIVVIGVGVAEHQLVELTQRQDQGRFFYIGRNQDHVYSAYVFGQGISFRYIYLLGKVSMSDHDISFETGNYHATIPTQLNIDTVKLQFWFEIWRRQFVDEALKTKQSLTEYWNELKPYVDNIGRYVRKQLHTIWQQAAEYVRLVR